MRALIHSLVNLICLVSPGLLSEIRAWLKGDEERAAAEFASALIYLHDDLASIGQRVSQRLHRDESPARILVVELDRLGDMVNVTPTIRATREKWPNAEIDVVAHPSCLTIIENLKDISSCYAYSSSLYYGGVPNPFSPRKWSTLIALWARRYDRVLYSRGSFLFLTHTLLCRTHATKYLPEEPTVLRNLKMLDADMTLDDVGPLYLPVKHGMVTRWSDGGSFKVVIHATASTLTKAWPAERFAGLADRFAVAGASVTFLGAPNERQYLESLVALCAENHLVAVDLGLQGVVEQIRSADVFIGNDSGLDHIAAACGTRSVVVWGPTDLGANRPHLEAGKLAVHSHDLSCRASCVEYRCHNDRKVECLLRTSVEEVFDSANQLLATS